MLKEGHNKLFTYANKYVPEKVVQANNKKKSWKYGFDETHDLIVISKDGTIGNILKINELYIALPEKPKKVYRRSRVKKEQYWEAKEYPKALKSIPTIFAWNETGKEFQEKWIPYIETEFERREDGFWFYNNGEPTYITGSHYMYLQWTKIDVGVPDYRESNRIFFIF